MDIGGTQVCADNSFEAASNNLFFRAAISHNFVLEANNRTKARIVVTPEGIGGANNHDSLINATYIALAVEA